MNERGVEGSPPGVVAVEDLAWDKQQGLLPAVVQDATNQRVLMLGYMDREALQHTLATRRVTFWSRSKGRLWTKGESSGHMLELVDIRADCDLDTLLVQALPRGPTCHLGTPSCFRDAPAAEQAPASAATADAGEFAFLHALDTLIAQRERERPADSYSTRLFEAGIRRIAQKVGEEGVEVTLAAVAQDDDALLGESADLLYHLVVLLRARGLGLADAVRVLQRRHRVT
jgi:phosphoribosyl-AMP cyclohydrolase / phosphoribosyl-ATP pyrophosphohydrolase